jgi:hypothetical protein
MRVVGVGLNLLPELSNQDSEILDNISLVPKPLSCRKKSGTYVAQFLVEHFNLLGFEVQNWMIIAVGLIIAYIVFVWRTRDLV